jgi:hypothetical protein
MESERSTVRVVITFASDGKDLNGTFLRDGSDPVSFHGWLDLLRHLEAAGESAGEPARSEGS